MFNTKAREIIQSEFSAFQHFSDSIVKADGVNLGGMVVKDIILKGRDEDYAKSMKKMLINRALPLGITAVGTRI